MFISKRRRTSLIIFLTLVAGRGAVDASRLENVVLAKDGRGC